MNEITLRLITPAAGILGLAAVLLATSLYGAGLSPESAYYLSAARNIANGEGFLLFTGAVMTDQAPLFPLVLSLSEYLFGDAMTGARLVNALSFGMIVYISGNMLLRNLHSTTLAVIGVLSILFSWTLVHLSSMVWTDSLFILFALSFVKYISEYLDSGSTAKFILFSAAAAAACLQRYVGVTLVLSGAILILFLDQQSNFSDRVKKVVYFALMALTPIALWMLRNLIISSKLTGTRDPSATLAAENIQRTADVISSWFIPEAIPAEPRLVLFLITAGVLIFAFLKTRKTVRTPLALLVVYSSGIFSAAYIVFMVASATRVALDPLDARYMAPALIFLIFIFLTIVDASVRYLRHANNSSKFRTVIFGLCVLWLLNSSIVTILRVSESMETGAGGYNSSLWQRSAILESLRAEPLSGKIYSNDPYAIYLLTGANSQLGARKYAYNSNLKITEDLDRLRETVESGEEAYLVWFSSINRPHFHTVEEYSAVFTLQELQRHSDGSVHLLADVL